MSLVYAESDNDWEAIKLTPSLDEAPSTEITGSILMAPVAETFV